MSQRKTKARKKSKSNGTSTEIVRTDVWQLAASSSEKEQLLLTVQEYRAYLRPLVLVVNAQWQKLVPLTSSQRVNAVEKMIHVVVNKNKCQLSMPIKVKKVTLKESDFVASVDLGINSAATAAIVGKAGTVKARAFINPVIDIDRRNRRRMMIAKRTITTTNLTKDKLPKGFCKGLYRKSSNINLEISRKVACSVIAFAIEHNVQVIVLENMAGWKAKAGRRGTLLKQKFHLWCHRQIVSLIKQRWTELGGTVKEVNPKYTSAYAFDGSGKVRRCKHNYSLARFSTGKQYNADLNAAYNIGARYWYCSLMGDKTFSRVFDSKSSDGTLRTPVTLGTLRQLAASS